jgi:hypothetical protein
MEIWWQSKEMLKMPKKLRVKAQSEKVGSPMKGRVEILIFEFIIAFSLQFDKNSRFLCSKSERKDNSGRRRTFPQRQLHY